MADLKCTHNWVFNRQAGYICGKCGVSEADVIVEGYGKPITTYEQVAARNHLPQDIRETYLLYMRARWADTEHEKCHDGYADEWAQRFKNGNEYHMSDTEGRTILRNISSNYSMEAHHEGR